MWSINERLGGKPGLDIPPLDPAFLDDYLALWIERLEAQQRDEGEEADEEELEELLSGNW